MKNWQNPSCMEKIHHFLELFKVFQRKTAAGWGEASDSTSWPSIPQSQTAGLRTCFFLQGVFRKQWREFTLQGMNISHLGKRKIIFKMPFLGDMLVPWYSFYPNQRWYKKASSILDLKMLSPARWLLPGCRFLEIQAACRPSTGRCAGG